MRSGGPKIIKYQDTRGNNSPSDQDFDIEDNNRIRRFLVSG